VAKVFAYLFPKLSATAGDTTRYHAMAARTIIPSPPQAKLQLKSVAAADTLGTSIATPSTVATSAARRAQLFSRNNPQPMSAPAAHTSRNI
jgi:hypothetical protein